jgi:hypothetical protein
MTLAACILAAYANAARFYGPAAAEDYLDSCVTDARLACQVSHDGEDTVFRWADGSTLRDCPGMLVEVL